MSIFVSLLYYIFVFNLFKHSSYLSFVINNRKYEQVIKDYSESKEVSTEKHYIV